MGDTILYTALSMLGLALVFCIGLVIANVRLAVFVDPVQKKVEAALPGANCGNCGFPGCAPYAEAVFNRTTSIDKCTVGGPQTLKLIAEALGVEAKETYPFRPVLHCGATASQRLQRGNYKGVPTCTAADVVGGVQGCTYGCLGFGDCVAACEYDAMELVDGLPRFNYDNCIGCGDCVRACPRKIIEQIPFKKDRMMVVACNNRDPGKAVRDVCTVGCIGCSACARVLPGVFEIEDNVAKIDYDKITGDEDWDAALAKCPMDSMIFFGKPLPQYEEELKDVEEVLVAGKAQAPQRPTPEDMEWRG